MLKILGLTLSSIAVATLSAILPESIYKGKLVFGSGSKEQLFSQATRGSQIPLSPIVIPLNPGWSESREAVVLCGGNATKWASKYWINCTQAATVYLRGQTKYKQFYDFVTGTQSLAKGSLMMRKSYLNRNERGQIGMSIAWDELDKFEDLPVSLPPRKYSHYTDQAMSILPLTRLANGWPVYRHIYVDKPGWPPDADWEGYYIDVAYAPPEPGWLKGKLSNPKVIDFQPIKGNPVRNFFVAAKGDPVPGNPKPNCANFTVPISFRIFKSANGVCLYKQETSETYVTAIGVRVTLLREKLGWESSLPLHPSYDSRRPSAIATEP